MCVKVYIRVRIRKNYFQMRINYENYFISSTNAEILIFFCYYFRDIN